jgi:H+/Cl- antiporter ClcA
MQPSKAPKLPRKFTITLLWAYIFMGIVSIAAGGYLSYTAYEMRLASSRHGSPMPGSFYVMLVGGVIVVFGIWRCALASYHLFRLRARRPAGR